MSIQTPEWVKDAVFYQIFPDRFARSERNKLPGLRLEPWDTPPNPYGFKGGDLYGVLEHLDYLKDLGINAIYFNPITASASNHRYHTYDYFHIDPLLGGDQAFRELLDGAHAAGIRIVPDGVFNHASRGFWPFHHVLENGNGSPYVDWFHFNPIHLSGKKHWGAYPGEQEQQQLDHGVGSFDALGYQAWWNLPALPKFNTNSPAAREFIFQAAVHWIEFGADGWRLDVAAEINDDSFWQEFRRRVKAANPDAYIVAEIWHESQRWLQGDQFDAVMNYLVTAALMSWLIGDRIPDYAYRIGGLHKVLHPMTAAEFGDRIEYLLGLYDPEINYVQFNLIDSHDTPRFLTTSSGNEWMLRLAYFFLFTYVGAPCIYYGDEIGMEGGPDPECRKAFDWDEKTWNHGLRSFMKDLTQLRNSQPALRRGSFQIVYSDKDVIVFIRQYQGDTVIAGINSSVEEKQIDIDLSRFSFPAMRMLPIFGNSSAEIIDGKVTSLIIKAHEGVVFKLDQ